MTRLRQTARTKRNASASPRHRRERAQMAGGAWGEPRRPNKHARTNVSHETLRGTPRFGAGSRLQLHVEPHGFGRSPTTDPTGPRRPWFDGKTPASWQQSTGLVIPPSASLDVSRTRAGETPSIALGRIAKPVDSYRLTSFSPSNPRRSVGQSARASASGFFPRVLRHVYLSVTFVASNSQNMHSCII